MAKGAIKGITIELGGDTTSLDKALTSVNKKARDIQSELKQVDKLLKLDPKNTELLAQKQKLLAEAIANTKEKLATLKEAEKQAQEQFAKGEISEEAYRELKREIIATENQLKALEKEAAASNITLQKVADATKKIGDAAVSAGKAMMPLTGAIVGAGAASVGFASNFNDSMAKASTLIDTTVYDMDDLKDKILEVSDETGVAADQLGESMYNALSASIPMGEQGADMMAFLTSNARLARVGFTDIDTAVTATAKTLNAYNLDVSETDRIHRILLQTQNLGIATVDELGQNLAKVTPTAAAMGVSFENVGASLAVMTAQGTPAAQATTQLNALISELGKEGTKSSTILREKTGRSFKELMESGMSLTEVLSIMQMGLSSDAQAISELMSTADKATGSTMTFEEACAALGISAGDVEGELIDMFGSLEAGKASLALGGQNADKFTEALAAMSSESDVVGEAFDKLETDSFTLEKAINQIKNIAIDFGNVLLNMLRPILENVAGKVKEFSEWFKNLSDAQKENIAKIAAVVAAIGPMLIVFGKVMQSISGIISIITKVGPAIKAVKTAFSALSAAFAANPVGLVVAAIAALVAILVVAYNKCEWFREMVDEAFAGIKESIGQAIEAVKPIIQDLIQSFQNVMEALKPIIQQVVQAFQNLLAALRPVAEFIIKVVVARIKSLLAILPNIISAVKNVIDFVTNIINAFSALFKGDLDGFVGYIKAAIQNVKDFISNILTAIVTFVVSFLENMGVDIKQIFTNIWEGIKSIFSGIGQWFADRWNDIVTAFSTAATWFQTTFQTAWDNIVAVFSAIGQWFAARWLDIQNALSTVATWFLTMFQTAWNNIVAVFSAIGQWFAARWQDVRNALSTVATWFQTMFQNAWNNIVAIFSAIGQWFAARWQDIKNALSTVASWFLTMFQNAYNNVTSVFAAIGQWFAARWTDIKNALSSVASWFQTTFTNAYNNVKNVFNAIGSWFGDRFNDIKNALAEIPNFFKNIFNQAWENVKSVFSGVASFFQGIYDTVVGIFSSIADKVRGAIQGAVNSANSVTSNASGGNVTMMATGGRLRNGRAIVAEAGPELIEMVNGEAIVTPLTNKATNTPVTQGGGSQGGGGAFVQNVNITSPTPLTPAETARQTRNATRRMVLQLQKG